MPKAPQAPSAPSPAPKQKPARKSVTKKKSTKKKSTKKKSAKKATSKKKSTKKKSTKKTTSKKKSTSKKSGAKKDAEKKPARKSKAAPLTTPPSDMPKKPVPDAGMSPTVLQRMFLISKKPDGYTPAEYAQVAYEGSPGWNKDCRTGAGRNSEEVFLVKGGAMNIAAGASLAKMMHAGLLDMVEEGRTKRYFVSSKGRKAYNKAVKVYRDRLKKRKK